MTDNAQELDELLNHLMQYSYDYGSGNIPTSENPPLIIARQTKRALLDWHNKQVEEVLDRLESSSFGIKQYIEVSQYPARSVYEPEHIAAIHKVVPLSAIEAGRNKLKESK